MVLLLRRSEVEDLLDLKSARECMERTYRDQAAGGVNAAPPSQLNSGGAMMLVRAGGLAEQKRLGFRISKAGGRGWALVWDSPDGELQTIVDYPFSILRVGATVALAVDKLIPGQPKKIGVIGSSGIAWAGLSGACSVRRLDDVRIFSPDAEHRTAFANRAVKELGAEARPVASAELAAKDADLLIIATSSNAPVLAADSLPASCVVMGAGSRQELGPDFYRRAQLVITTSKVHEQHQREWPLSRVIQDGDLTWDDVAELGQAVVGQATNPGGFTVFREAQGGFSDIALAAFVAEKAAALGRGLNWEL